jgi:mono/diheme cytochrome c family protein
MDFPVFHLDFFGNRTLIGVIAVLHVYVNHALAVGAIPLITLMEWWGYRKGDPAWDRLAYRLLFVCFIVTTTVGALTGVGIWLASALVNPSAIGSLIRVFFWAWFTEWIVFVTEVSLILTYFLTWKHWTGSRKRMHILVGVILSLCSWLTMAIIVAILGFMMDTGRWPESPSLIRGVLNPVYLPQLMFRTPYAMVAAGLLALLLSYFFTRRDTPFRGQAIRWMSIWTLAWVPLWAAGAAWYWSVIPEHMLSNLPVALATQALADWHATLAWIIVAAAGVILLIAIIGAAWPARVPRVALAIPFLLCLMQLGFFERVREFIRKPEVIEAYMYSNGVRKGQYALLRQDGLLAHATYAPMRTITDANRQAAGREIFKIACTRCHTTTGVNGVSDKLARLWPQPWDAEIVQAYLANMHNTRPFMPPFPGTDRELEALTAYLLALPKSAAGLEGAQAVGVELPHGAAPETAGGGAGVGT